MEISDTMVTKATLEESSSRTIKDDDPKGPNAATWMFCDKTTKGRTFSDKTTWNGKSKINHHAKRKVSFESKAEVTGLYEWEKNKRLNHLIIYLIWWLDVLN